MNRREFVKLAGMAVFLGVFPSGKSAFAQPAAGRNGKYYRGAPNGEIQVSYDQKRTWQKHVGFGSDYSIEKLFSRDNGRMTAEVHYRNRAFTLSLSDDETSWLIS